MENTGWAPETAGTTLWIGAPGDGLISLSRSLLSDGLPFVVVARSLPSAVRLAQELAPEEADLLARAVQVSQGPARVVVFRGHARPAQRRAWVADQAAGRTVGLILTPEDLDSFRVAADFSSESAAEAVWVVEDAHRLSVFAPDHVPSLRALARVHRFAGRLLLTDLDDSQVISDLGRLLSFGAEAVRRATEPLPSTVRLHVDRQPDVLHARSALSEALRRHLPSADGARAVVVAPLRTQERQQGLPTSELISVAEELGLHPLQDPGENADTEASRWRNILRQPSILLLSDDAEALGGLPAGGQAPVFVRLEAPLAPEVVLQEVHALARAGGGSWVYIGDGVVPEPRQLPLEEVERALSALIAGREGDGPEAFDLLGAMAGVQLSLSGAALAQALFDTLSRLAGLGWVGDVRAVRLSLEVAEAGRLRPPFISGEPRYEALVSAYDRALQALPMAESVRFRLEAREPHDLRVLSQRLGYPVAALNGLFDDLGRDGIVVCQQRVLGTRGTINVELLPGRSWAEVRAALPDMVRALGGLRDREMRRRAGVRAVLASESCRSALEAALSEELDAAPLPVSSVSVLGAMPEVLVAGQAAPRVELASPDAPVVAAEPAPPVDLPPSTATAIQTDSLADGLDALAGAGLTMSQVAALAQQLSEASDAAARVSELELGTSWQRVAAALARVGMWEAEKAVAALVALAGEGADLPWSELISRVEFQLMSPDGVAVAEVPAAVRELALSLPLAEALAGEDAWAVLGRAAVEGVVVDGADFGSTRVSTSEGQRFVLERRGCAPEVEALLWLAVHELEPSEPAVCVRVARLAEAFLAVAGLVEPQLTQRLAKVVLDHGPSTPGAMSEARWQFAIVRAMLTTGSADEALTRLLEMSVSSGQEAERIKVLARAAVRAQRPEAALTWSAGDTRGPGAFDQMVAALGEAFGDTRVQDMQALAESYQPGPDRFWSFWLSNPFGLDPQSQQARMEAAAQSGLPAIGAAQLEALFEGSALDWPVDLVGEVFAVATAPSRETWLGVSTRLLKAARPSAARMALERAGDLGEDSGAHLLAARLCLDEQDVPGALTHGLFAPSEGFTRALRRHLGDGWVEQLEALMVGGSLTEAQTALVQRMVSSAQEQAQLGELRAGVERALESGRWDDVRAAVTALKAAVGLEQRDRVLENAYRKLDERAAHLEGRLRDLQRRPPQRRRPMELERLVQGAEALGLDGLIQAARALVEQTQAAAVSEPQRPGGGGERQDRTSQRPARQAPARQAPTRQSPERQSPAAWVFEGSPEDMPARLKEVVGKLSQDRERATVTVSVLKRAFESNPEVAIKALKECLSAFERVEALDAGLARVVRNGQPADEHLSRLRRSLSGMETRFRSTIEVLANRENPEPWKQLLGQLKLGS